MIKEKLIEVTAIDQIVDAADENSMTLYEHDEHGLNSGMAESYLKVARVAGKNMADKQSDSDNGTKTSSGRRTEGRAKVGKRNVKAEVAAMAP